jgi:drug/metabolite transporter (DMT)-like permease
LDSPRPVSNPVAVGLILFSACCFGAISTLVLLATRTGLTLFTVLALRYLIAGALMAVALYQAMQSHRSTAIRLVIAGGCGQALIAGVSLSSLRWIDAATLGFLFYTYPAWVTALAALRRTEPLDARKIMALVLSLAGIACIVLRPGAASLHPIGITLALTASIIYATYIPLIGKMQGSLSPTQATACIGTGAALIFTAIALAPGDFTLRLTLPAWTAVATLAIVCTALAFVLFLRGLAVLGPVRTSIISTIEPFFTALIAAVLLGQGITLATLVGGALIASAVVVLQTGARTIEPIRS